MNSPQPGWLPALIGHVHECGIRRGGLAHVEVRHDDDCGRWEGRACDCDPAIESGERIDRKYRNGGG